MGELINIVTPLHQSTRRDYIGRMMNQKVECMKTARKYGRDFWDGDRKFGYGGHSYIPGWWRSAARGLLDRYSLKAGSTILDAGCGKGYLLYEMSLLEPGLIVAGFDISEYALSHAKEEIRANLFRHNLKDAFPFEEDSFDLVISLNCLHNLSLPEVCRSLSEIQRVGKESYVLVESFRNEAEFFNVQCWALTADTLVNVDSWKWLHEKSGYTGDYEFIFFE